MRALCVQILSSQPERAPAFSLSVSLYIYIYLFSYLFMHNIASAAHSQSRLLTIIIIFVFAIGSATPMSMHCLSHLYLSIAIQATRLQLGDCDYSVFAFDDCYLFLYLALRWVGAGDVVVVALWQMLANKRSK